MIIREATKSELKAVLQIQREAFGYDKEAELVNDMLADASGEPYLSLLALEDDKAIGHILFSKARIVGGLQDLSIRILAPLAIVPGAQNQGVGGKLIERGLELLSQAGVDLVFVLGHPGYYPRYGFKTAGVLGFDAPYPIPEKDADAWMVQELRPGVIGTVRGQVMCSDALNLPQHWRE